MAELADAADLKSAGAILVGSSTTLGIIQSRVKVNMLWLIILLAYLLGSTPTAYIAGRLLKGKDIRRIGITSYGRAIHKVSEV